MAQDAKDEEPILENDKYRKRDLVEPSEDDASIHP
jgi:hypothetical protein